MNNEPLLKLQQLLKEKQLDAFFVTNFYSILYLTGVQTLVPEEREAFVLVTQQNIYFFTDARYSGEELDTKLSPFGGVLKIISSQNKLTHHLETIIQTDVLKTVAFEEEDLKYYEYHQLSHHLPGVTLKPLLRVVHELREIKTDQEIQAIRKACELTDACFTEILPLIKVGMKEKELAWIMEKWIREHDCLLAFDPIVAADKNSAVPHYDTKHGNGTIKKGSVVLLDFGVRYENYNSDITRMVFMGTQPSTVIDTYQKLLSAQESALQAVGKDRNLAEIDKLCRDSLIKSGLPSYPHSTGHGVGLEVHEFPKVSPTSTDSVKVGQVFTIEPGIYLPGNYGMRIEDTVSINSQYKAQILTKSSKELCII